MSRVEQRDDTHQTETPPLPSDKRTYVPGRDTLVDPDQQRRRDRGEAVRQALQTQRQLKEMLRPVHIKVTHHYTKALRNSTDL